EDLGVRHRLWVYSGRRGVHCWVCDDEVRKWSPALRAAAVEYLTLVKVGHPRQSREVEQGVGPCPRGYPSQRGSMVLGGRGVCVGGMGSTVSAVSLDRCSQHRELLQAEFPKKRDSVQRWELLKSKMERTRRAPGAGKSSPCYGDWEVMLQFCFPRLDINVSKGVGHLLKSPFSVHPKTGRISVPLDLQRLDQFDPFAVPTISSLCHELDAASGDGEQDSGETEPKRRVRDYKRTSLAPYVRVFEQFVEEMEQARKGELLRRSDLQGDF
ncbi:DNA primase small subunit, partial [Dryobates pubescens]